MVLIFPKSFRSSILPHPDLFNSAFRVKGKSVRGKLDALAQMSENDLGTSAGLVRCVHHGNDASGNY